MGPKFLENLYTSRKWRLCSGKLRMSCCTIGSIFYHFLVGGVRLHLCTAVASDVPNGHSLDSGWKNVFWNCSGMIPIGKKLSQCHWAHHKPTWTALESNPVLRGEKTGFPLLLSIHLRTYLSLFLQNFLLRRISVIVSIPIWIKQYLHCQHHNYTNNKEC